jgi:2-polyprenyl-3-methyl-5-hydroxy-6-metoxy-1,4-benzoquinol methylase
MTELVACVVCGVEESEPQFERHGLMIVRCRRCHLAYVNPRPPWPECSLIYRDETYYRNANMAAFGYGDYLGEQQVLLQPLVAERVRYLARFRSGGGRLLDVGCATGLLLQAAQDLGWDAEGVDVSDFAVSVCRQRGLIAHHGSVEDVSFPTGRFDVAVMDDTIEHLPDPRRTLEEMHRVLAPDGVLTINTCDDGGWLRRAMGRHWFHYKPLEHLWYFDRNLLARLLDETGFTVLETKMSGKIVTLRYLCGRLRAYTPLGSRVALATVARLNLAARPFFLPIGEFVTFARRR